MILQRVEFEHLLSDKGIGRAEHWSQVQHDYAIRAGLYNDRGEQTIKQALKHRRQGYSAAVAFEELTGLEWRIPHTTGKTGGPNFVAADGVGIHVRGRPFLSAPLILQDPPKKKRGGDRANRRFVLSTSKEWETLPLWVFRGFVLAGDFQTTEFLTNKGDYVIPQRFMRSLWVIPGLGHLFPDDGVQSRLFV